MNIIEKSIAKLNVIVLVRAVLVINLKINALASFLFMASSSLFYFSSFQKNKSSLTMNSGSTFSSGLPGRHGTYLVYPGVRWGTHHICC